MQDTDKSFVVMHVYMSTGRFETVYSDTSANEDNSFRNHIR